MMSHRDYARQHKEADLAVANDARADTDGGTSDTPPAMRHGGGREHAISVLSLPMTHHYDSSVSSRYPKKKTKWMEQSCHAPLITNLEVAGVACGHKDCRNARLRKASRLTVAQRAALLLAEECDDVINTACTSAYIGRGIACCRLERESTRDAAGKVYADPLRGREGVGLCYP